MVARLAKNPNGDRRRVAPVVRAFDSELGELSATETRAVRIVPSNDSGARELATNELDRLYAALAAVTPEEHPRTAKLLASGTRKVAQKVIEEAGEVALAAVKHNNRGIVRESADLLYHLAVLWRHAGIGSDKIWDEMRHRADNFGIAEKLPKSTA